MKYVIVIGLLASPAFAEDRSVFYDTWGDDMQCAGAPLQPGGTVMAAPFELTPGWLVQRGLWCRLTWFPVEAGRDEVRSGAYAQCGEDSVRDYILGMRLEDDRLTLHWDFLTSNGPLRRCETDQ
jgi:hypothetical protein